MPQDSVLYINNGDTAYWGPKADMPEGIKAIVEGSAYRMPQQGTDSGGTVIFYFCFSIAILVIIRQLLFEKKTRPFGDTPRVATVDPESVIPQTETVCLVYKGRDLDFKEADVVPILEKRFPFYLSLSFPEQKRFLLRHKTFMRSKIFKIHDDEGFKEMPVLISAAAVQLSFGLEEYMLNSYPYINIFPQEFMRISEGIHFLEGTVSGNNIKISWKHFLEGYALPENGENVGLHEMAHAYYSQNFLFKEDEDPCFIKGFMHFNACGQKAYENEQTCSNRFYSDYALRNLQEFWAESAERFFEEPEKMKIYYPELYECMCTLLNQRPCSLIRS